MKLNLGCGNSKLEGYINIDCDETVKPDQVINICSFLPWETDSIEKILFLHTIEHLEKRLYPTIFSELHRILQPDGLLILAYPEFEKCARNWLENTHGKRDFWEMTIYGRQSCPSDFHVSIMNTVEIKDMLDRTGFKNIQSREEIAAPYNTIVECQKGNPLPRYEEILDKGIFGDKHGNSARI